MGLALALPQWESQTIDQQVGEATQTGIEKNQPRTRKQD